MNFAAIDLNVLRVFDAMMLELSTVSVGERLGMAQPAVNAAIGQLRHIANDELFVRDGTRMVVTPRAEQLCEPVRSALRQLEAALGEVAAFDPANAADCFTILGSDYVSTLLMPELARTLARLAPGATVRMLDLPGIDVFGLLGDGLANLAVDRAMDPPEWILRQRLFRSHMLCAARRGHPALALAGISPGDAIPAQLYCSIPHVMMSMDGGRRGSIDPLLEERGHARRVVATVPNFHAVALTVAATDLIGTLPIRFARQAAAFIDLDFYMLPFDLPPSDVHLYWHRRNDRDPAQAWLRARVTEVLGVDE